MKVTRLAVFAAVGVMGMSAAGAQTQTCKRLPRIAQGGDVAISRADDGSLWYAASNPNRIVRRDTNQSETPIVPVDGSTSGLSGLAFDGMGNLWYSKTSGRIGKLPLAGGEGVEYAIPESNAFPRGIALGPDGQMWYFDPVKKHLGRVAADGSVTPVDPPPKLNPFMPEGMAFGIDNSVWVTDVAQNALFKLDIASRTWKRYDIPDATSQPGAIRVAKDGTVWFTMRAVKKIGRFRNGAFTSIDIDQERPEGLHIADDQSVWLTTSFDSLWRLKPDGSHEKYKCSGTTGPLTTTADGTVYALGNPNMLVLKPGDTTSPPKVAATSNSPGLMPLGPSPVREVTLPELRKLFDDKTKKLVVHYTVLPRKGCGPCDESTAVFEEFARKNAGKAVFVRIANEYSEAAWADPWYKANANLSGVPTYITYYDQKEVARVAGRESAPVLDARLLPAR